MLIRVMYQDGRFDMVKPQMLDALLDDQRVDRFQRGQGWAIVGRDVLRKARNSGQYHGPERRLL